MFIPNFIVDSGSKKVVGRQIGSAGPEKTHRPTICMIFHFLQHQIKSLMGEFRQGEAGFKQIVDFKYLFARNTALSQFAFFHCSELPAILNVVFAAPTVPRAGPDQDLTLAATRRMCPFSVQQEQNNITPG